MKKLPVALLLLFMPALVMAWDVCLTWEPSPSPDAIGYNVYINRDTPGPPFEFKEDAGNVLEYKYYMPQVGTTYYFAVTCYDDMHESDYSNQVSIVNALPELPPEAPGSLKCFLCGMDG